MKIAIATDGHRHPYAAALIHALSDTGHPPRLVVSTARTRWGKLRESMRRYGWSETLTRVGRRADSGASHPDSWQALRAHGESEGWPSLDKPISRLCRSRGIAIVSSPTVNTPRAVEAVRAAGIDLLLNAGGGLYRQAIGEAVRIGILNAHMGPLPGIRGMNALEWSLFLGEPASVTIHFIDAGVDTGDILLARPLSVGPGDTIDTLRARSLALNVELMTEAVRQIATDDCRRTPQPPDAGRQYFVMHPRLRKFAESHLSLFP